MAHSLRVAAAPMQAVLGDVTYYKKPDWAKHPDEAWPCPEEVLWPDASPLHHAYL